MFVIDVAWFYEWTSTSRDTSEVAAVAGGVEGGDGTNGFATGSALLHRVVCSRWRSESLGSSLRTLWMVGNKSRCDLSIEVVPHNEPMESSLVDAARLREGRNAARKTVALSRGAAISS
jgi:hypothetical protein